MKNCRVARKGKTTTPRGAVYDKGLVDKSTSWSHRVDKSLVDKSSVDKSVVDKSTSWSQTSSKGSATHKTHVTTTTTTMTREQQIKREMFLCQNMMMSELRKELRELGISMKSFSYFEKKESTRNFFKKNVTCSSVRR